MDFIQVLSILPTPPSGTPSNIAVHVLSFFGKWIVRIGGMVAFIGLVKLGLSLKEENAKEQMEAVLIAISGFMIRSAIRSLNVFKTVPTDADTEFSAILSFIGSWTRKVGTLGMFLGAIIFALSFRENNANGKVTGVRTMSAGGVIICVSAMIYFFA